MVMGFIGYPNILQGPANITVFDIAVYSLYIHVGLCVGFPLQNLKCIRFEQ